MKLVGIFLFCILIFERLDQISSIEFKSDLKNLDLLFTLRELNDILSNDSKINKLNKTYAMIDLKNNEIVWDLESLTKSIYEITEVKFYFIHTKDY
jgi:hypothetical protein